MKTIRGLAVFVLAAVSLASQADVTGKSITYTHKDKQYVGYMAFDDTVKNRRPGILVVHEWWGLNDFIKAKADELAKLGYVAFAPDMYGDGKVTIDPEEAGQWYSKIDKSNLYAERAMAGLRVLEENEHVKPGQLAAIGFCFGGTTVLKAAYAGAPLKGVVSFHGHLPAASAREAASVTSAMLVLHGAADPHIKPDQVSAFEEALSKSRTDWQIIVFGNAQHGFTNPNASKVGMPGLAYDEQAANRSWNYMRVFLDQLLGTGTSE